MLLKGSGSLAKPLARVIVDGVVKPAQRADAVSALMAAVSLAAADSSVDAVLDSEKVWQLVGRDDSALLSAAAAARLPAEEAAVAAQVAQELLLKVPAFG